MKRVTSIATACIAAVVLTIAATVGAQDFNTQERTFLTFSSAVELPGMTLPAGTYTFRLADTPGRNVVQVLSQDEMEVHGQFLFVQAQRPEVTGETVITFRETKEGTTPAVQYWYYPGEKIGTEFIYPKDQAMKIAARTGQNVRTEEGLITANGTVTSTDTQGQVTEWQREQTTTAAAEASVAGGAVSASASADRGNTRDDQATALATEPAAQHTGAEQPAATQTAQADAATHGGANPAAAGVSADATAQTTQTARAADPMPQAEAERPVGTSGAQAESTIAQNETPAELPRTASPLALSGILGLLSLAGAAGVRALRR
jgi:hypothetical protein